MKLFKQICLILAFFLFPVWAYAVVVSVDTTSYSDTGNTESTSLTWPHTISSDATIKNKRLYVIVAIHGTTSTVRSISSVTYNGVPLTKIVNKVGPSIDYCNDFGIWYLNNPISGTHNIVVTVSGTSGIGASGISFLNTTANSTHVSNTNSGSTASPYVAITTPYPNEIVVGGVCTYRLGGSSPSISDSSGQTMIAYHSFRTGDDGGFTFPTPYYTAIRFGYKFINIGSPITIQWSLNTPNENTSVLTAVGSARRILFFGKVDNGNVCSDHTVN